MLLNKYNTLFVDDNVITKKYENYTHSRKDYIFVSFHTRFIYYLLILFLLIKISKISRKNNIRVFMNALII